jgi:hypothetical protein
MHDLVDAVHGIGIGMSQSDMHDLHALIRFLSPPIVAARPTSDQRGMQQHEGRSRRNEPAALASLACSGIMITVRG